MEGGRRGWGGEGDDGQVPGWQVRKVGRAAALIA